MTPEHRVRNTNPKTESFLEETPIVNQTEEIRQAAPPLTSSDSQEKAGTAGPAFVTDPDGYFVGIAISGGGSRSANFAAGCLFELQKIGILKKVDFISAVSGGSLAAALYCTSSDDEWNCKRVEEKLTHPYASDLVGQVFLPWNLASLFWGSLTRSDLLAEDFTHVMFSRGGKALTFADLRADRPRLLINATDMQTGSRFTFCNTDFNQINSDLNSFPLGYAVCASSAVPVVIHPVTLRDYSTIFPHFYHLVDGGIYDNLGARILVESYEAQIQKSVNPYPHGAIIIIIDADTRFDGHLSNSASIGLFDSIREGLGLSSTVLLTRANSATMAELVTMHSSSRCTADQLREKINQLWRDHYVEIRDSKEHPVRVLHIGLTQVGEFNAAFGASVNSVRTDFDIEPSEAYELYKAAEILFDERFNAHLAPLVKEIETGVPATRPSTTQP